MLTCCCGPDAVAVASSASNVDWFGLTPGVFSCLKFPPPRWTISHWNCFFESKCLWMTSREYFPFSFQTGTFSDFGQGWYIRAQLCNFYGPRLWCMRMFVVRKLTWAPWQLVMSRHVRQKQLLLEHLCCLKRCQPLHCSNWGLLVPRVALWWSCSAVPFLEERHLGTIHASVVLYVHTTSKVLRLLTWKHSQIWRLSTCRLVPDDWWNEVLLYCCRN